MHFWMITPMSSSSVLPSATKVMAFSVRPRRTSARGNQAMVGIVCTHVVYTAGVSAAAKQPDAAKALIAHLTTPAAASVIEMRSITHLENRCS